MASESDSDLSSDDLSEETASWIAWFCSIRGNEFFCMVDEEYITDSFNLSGLKEEVPYYDMAVETILDADQPSLQQLTEAQQESVDAAAELLYGLIHARFILTAKGLTLMVRVWSSVAWAVQWRIVAVAHHPSPPPPLPPSLPFPFSSPPPPLLGSPE
jgi:casein kinase II subunit beta